jgi:hypothetical protein
LVHAEIRHAADTGNSGFTFPAREARAKDGRKFLSFLPAISQAAMKAKIAGLRAMRIHRRTTWTPASWADGWDHDAPPVVEN